MNMTAFNTVFRATPKNHKNNSEENVVSVSMRVFRRVIGASNLSFNALNTFLTCGFLAEGSDGNFYRVHNVERARELGF